MMNQDAATAEAGRRADPPHPAGTGTLNAEDPLAHLVPDPASIRDPLALGAGPGNGEPLTIALWGPRRGAVFATVTAPGPDAAAATDSIAERVTACDDAALLYITRPGADSTGWAALADAAGHAGDDGRALLILQFADLVIRERNAEGRDDRVHQPAPDAPLWVLLIDDVAGIAADPEASALLSHICMANRAEGVAVVIAGEEIPGLERFGADLRTQADVAIDAGQLAGRAFTWEAGGAARLAAGRAAWLMPRPLEPALSALQPLLDVAAGHPIEDVDASWDDLGDDLGDGPAATPASRAAARPHLTTSPAGSWYAAQADHAASVIEDILRDEEPGPVARVIGHGLQAVAWGLLATQESVNGAGADVSDALFDAGAAIATAAAEAGGLAASPPRRRGMPRRRRGIEYTDPAVFTQGVIDGWADPLPDPAEVDWTARLAAALIPYATCQGRPVSPWAPTGIRRGRNGLGRWGESPMADALVTCRHHGKRYVLLVERRDGGGWAVPGGSIEAGEDGQAAAVRELEEETCLAVPLGSARAGLPRHVPDPRASDEAWAVTVPCEVDLGDVGELPPVKGRDDARRAAWLPARDYDDLLDSLITGYASTGTATVFTAHQQMLRAFLGGLPAVRHDDGPPVVIHTVGWFWRWVNRLGLAVPRSLCGQPQLSAPGQPRPGPGSPQCPACTAALAIRSRS